MSKEKVREALADYAHAARAGWMRYLFSKSYIGHDSGGHEECIIPPDLYARWVRQSTTPYAQLPEAEKESDRAEADKMLTIMEQDGGHPTLKAYCNGYDVVAAANEDEAREMIRQFGRYYDPEDFDGDGWEVLANSAPLRDEEGKPTGETVGEAVCAKGEPGYLWSCET